MACTPKLLLGMTLMKSQCEKPANFVFSAVSLGTALAMLAAGLNGETKKEVLGLLGYKDEAALHKMYAALISNKELPIKIANKILLEHNVEIKADFHKIARKKYKSRVDCVNFATNSDAISKDVNSWVSDKTNGMIKTLLEPDSVTSDTIMVLLNAVYFKATWAEKFESNNLEFTKRDGTKVKKDSIYQKRSIAIKYCETKHLRLVKIPYKEAGCYMVVAIPKDEKKHIDEVLITLPPDEMATAIDNLKLAHGPPVSLEMPKFKIDYKYEALVSTMQKLGVNKIFQAGVGDFTGLFAMVPSRPPSVSDIVHSCVIQVDDEGTTAAAVTSMYIQYQSLGEDFEKDVYVTIKKPFAFFVMSKEDHLLFQGLCMEPDPTSGRA